MQEKNGAIQGEMAHFEHLFQKMEVDFAECIVQADAKDVLVFKLSQNLSESQRQLAKTRSDNKRILDQLKTNNKHVQVLERHATYQDSKIDDLTEQMDGKLYKNSQLTKQVEDLDRKCENLDMNLEIATLTASSMQKLEMDIQHLTDHVKSRDLQIFRLNAKLLEYSSGLSDVRETDVELRAQLLASCQAAESKMEMMFSSMNDEIARLTHQARDG